MIAENTDVQNVMPEAIIIFLPLLECPLYIWPQPGTQQERMSAFVLLTLFFLAGFGGSGSIGVGLIFSSAWASSNTLMIFGETKVGSSVYGIQPDQWIQAVLRTEALSPIH
jgi:hypothetical protein